MKGGKKGGSSYLTVVEKSDCMPLYTSTQLASLHTVLTTGYHKPSYLSPKQYVIMQVVSKSNMPFACAKNCRAGYVKNRGTW